MPLVNLNHLAVLSVITLISGLSYGSQALFEHLQPGPLPFDQWWRFNALIACIWVSYFRACFTDPGWVPRGYAKADELKAPESIQSNVHICRKCNAFKPPRAHHCKICSKCVPKMDHHCPWTINCVSYRTFPHFFRFLFYAIAAMIYLQYFIFVRVGFIWERRDEASYLGPSATNLVLLFLLLLVNSMTLFAVGIIFLRHSWNLSFNVTTIEGWEIERHESLVRRARKHGGYLDGSDGTRIKLTQQEFPYDIGIFGNIAQGMVTSLLLWFFPFAPTPKNETGLSFETNGFDDRPWPPPDPERIPRKMFKNSEDTDFQESQDSMTDTERIAAFQKRQAADHQRFKNRQAPELLRRSDRVSAGHVWRDSDGDRLDDLGVDESVGLDDEDIPLSEVIRRRKDHRTTSEE